MDKLMKLNTMGKKLKEYLNSEKLLVLHKMKLQLDDQYYNTGDCMVPDSVYDMLKETLTKRDANYVPPVGAKIRDKENEVQLPFFLGSAENITPKKPKMLNSWLKKNLARDYVISEKLDGLSCLVVVKNGVTKLFTRGNGTRGGDITHYLPYFSTIPKLSKDIAVRGELIIPKSVFEEKYKGRTVNGREYRNARNMVSGLLVSTKTVRKGIKDIQFVAYEIVSDVAPKLSEQFETLSNLGFKVVAHRLECAINFRVLGQLWKETTSEFAIDGLIIHNNEPYDRSTEKYPPYMFAYKEPKEDEIKEAIVKNVEWNVSKWGQLKPVVIIHPVQLEDITISRATAHHAKYIQDNRIGKGAKILIVRSQEVIPYIMEVLEPAEKADMPTQKYIWDKNKVNILIPEAKKENEVRIKRIANFFSQLNIKHVSEQTVRKMVQHGLTNLFSILKATPQDLQKIPTFKEKLAQRTYDNIHNGLQNVRVTDVLGAYGVFGFGIAKKTLDTLFLSIPDIMEVEEKEGTLTERIMNVEGFSELTAKKIVKNLPNAKRFLKNLKKYATFTTDERVNDTMVGKKYVFSGFRNKELEQEITKRGGKVTGTVSKNTTALVVSDGANVTGKRKRAEELNVQVLSLEEFKSLL